MNKKLNASLSREQMKNIMGGTTKMRDDLKPCEVCWADIGPQPTDCLPARCEPIGPLLPTNPNALP